MDLRDLLSVLRARWIVLVASTLVGGVLALGASLLTTPTYQARVQFFATTSTGDGTTSAYQGALGAQQKVQSYAELVQSRDIARQVVERSGLEMSAEDVAAATSAKADSNTVLLNLAVVDVYPERSLRIAEGYANVLPDVISQLETPEGGDDPLAKLTVVNPPTLPTVPVAPKTEQNVAIGLMLGLLLGVSLILVVNALDRRVKSKEQIEAIAKASVVGAIPFRTKADREKDAHHQIPFRDGHSPAAESFRRLRTNLQFLNVDNPPRVLVLTSSVPTEGKSETSVNLALALAEAGNRVLLVEADLRRPRVVNYLNMPDKVGLTSILSGQAEFEDVVQETRHEGVDLLACGPLPPNPSELLASDTSQKLLADLRGKYDFVIIDSPPLLPVTDGALLARITDGALLVVRSHRTTADQLEQAADSLRKADAKLLGTIVVANKAVRRGSTEYYESHYYPSKQSHNVK